jgi:SAM-dependent methyltransferase
VIDHDNLDEFADAAEYDNLDSSDTGVAFYQALAQETGGPVLEIACGTGRVTIPIARQGLAVTGVDIVPGMIERARAKSAGLDATWVVGDARTFSLDERFRLIFLTGNAFQTFLTRADQEALLGRVRAHLAPRGTLAFETRNPRWRNSADSSEDRPAGEGLFAFLETREPEEQPPYRDRLGREVRMTLAQRYDHVAQILHWTSERRWIEDGVERTRVSRTAVRFTWPQELAALLRYNGFAVERQYGDWDRQPLSATSPSIIVVCRARP